MVLCVHGGLHGVKDGLVDALIHMRGYKVPVSSARLGKDAHGIKALLKHHGRYLGSINPSLGIGAVCK